MDFDWKKVVSTVAPVIGTALGGPLGGMAVKAIGDALGLSDATEVTVAQAIQGAKPEDLLKIKQAELQFAEHMKALDVDLVRIAATDRDSARKREIDVKDKTPAALAAFVTIGFFSILGYILAYGVPKQGGDALLLLLGSLATAWTGIMAYYFGSSSGSKEKDATLAHIAKS